MERLQSLLTLLYLPGLGAITYQRLYRHFGSAAAVMQAPDAELGLFMGARTLRALQAVRGSPGHLIHDEVKKQLEWLDAHAEIQLLTLGDADYPCLLSATEGAPAVLYVKGDPGILELPQIAIVGSRNPSAGGADNARQFARYLAEGGFAITSGLALGIDAAAHRGAMDGGGATLAVMGTGIDRLYPARNRVLAAEILERGGALITEFAPGTGSQAANFPRRNRIISGLSLGTLVVEAALQSGSLITARTALEQEREVFAIPGSIHNPLARGAHALIKNGAHLVETAADIVTELTGGLAYKREQLHEALPADDLNGHWDCDPLGACTPAETQLLTALGFDPVNLDALCERSGLEIGEVTSLLTELELKGRVQQSGCYISRR